MGLLYYRPQTKFAKVMFLQVSVILLTGGRAWLLTGGRAWLLTGGVCVVAHGGACVVAHRSGGACVVAHRGGMRGCSRGGGMHGCSWGGVHGCSRGGGRAWLLTGGACVVAHRGGMRGCSQGGCAWLLGGCACFFFLNEVGSMSGRYASYWNAFLFVIILYFLSFEEKKKRSEKSLDILTFLCHFMKVIVYSLIRAFKQVKSQELNSYCLVKLDEKL